MTRRLFVFFFVLCLLLTSCSQKEPQEEIRYHAETTMLSKGTPVYVEDYEAEGASVAQKYYEIRNKGNPDPEGWENIVTKENGDGFTFAPSSDVYSLSDEPMAFQLELVDVSEELVIYSFRHTMNLEKYESGAWVRLGLLSYDRLLEVPPTDSLVRKLLNGGGTLQDMVTYVSPAQWKEGMPLAFPLSIPLDIICPEPTPGQYRFVFYAVTGTEEESYKTKYYIPFEVTE